jgi:gliding motility-associated lipoprotein GldB
MRLIKQLFLIALAVLLLVRCTPKDKLNIDTSAISIKLDVIRFDSIFYSASAKDLPKIKKKFAYLFPIAVPDSIWLAKMHNPDSRYLFSEVQKTFSDFKEQRRALGQLFKHVKYYFPKFDAPKVLTLISDIDYNNKVIYTDSLLLISLDMYLGKEHEVYQNFPKYVKNSYSKASLPIDVAHKISFKSVPGQKTRSFIDRCVQSGKLMYVAKAFIPSVPDSLLLDYNSKKMAWAEANQEFVWRYFIDKKMLFNTDKNLYNRFLAEAPFSKFYLEIDRESPGRIGAFIGYKIVTSFMQNNSKSLIEMLQTPNDILFKQSKYKPRKQ